MNSDAVVESKMDEGIVLDHQEIQPGHPLQYEVLKLLQNTLRPTFIRLQKEQQARFGTLKDTDLDPRIPETPLTRDYHYSNAFRSNELSIESRQRVEDIEQTHQST